MRRVGDGPGGERGLGSPAGEGERAAGRVPSGRVWVGGSVSRSSGQAPAAGGAAALLGSGVWGAETGPGLAACPPLWPRGRGRRPPQPAVLTCELPGPCPPAPSPPRRRPVWVCGRPTGREWAAAAWHPRRDFVTPRAGDFVRTGRVRKGCETGWGWWEKSDGPDLC